MEREERVIYIYIYACMFTYSMYRTRCEGKIVAEKKAVALTFDAGRVYIYI